MHNYKIKNHITEPDYLNPQFLKLSVVIIHIVSIQHYTKNKAKQIVLLFQNLTFLRHTGGQNDVSPGPLSKTKQLIIN